MLWRRTSLKNTKKSGIKILEEADREFDPTPIRPCNLVRAQDAIANNFKMFGFRFVPIVWEELDVTCSLDVLFLRRGRPGKLFSEGDIDNRIKTLVDTLRCPNSDNEVAGITPCVGEDPFYCLLHDDKFLSHFSVETDDLHDPMDDDHQDPSLARLIITVEIKPWRNVILNSHLI